MTIGQFHPDDSRRVLGKLTARTQAFDLGVGDEGRLLPDDADISGASTVALLRAEVLLLTQAVRALLRDRSNQGQGGLQ